MGKLENREFLTCKEAAGLIRMSVCQFYKNLDKEGGPPVIRINQRVFRIPRVAFMKWLDSKSNRETISA